MPLWMPPTPRLMLVDSHDLLWYKLNETSASWANSGSAGALNLSVVGGSNPTLNATGLFGGCVSNIGATNGLASANTAVAETATSWSSSMWVWLRTFSPNFLSLFCKQYRGDGTWTTPFISIQMNLNNTGDGKWNAAYQKSGVTIQVAAAAVDMRLLLNQWMLISMTSDNTTLTAYLNGQLVGTAGGGGTVDYGTHGRWTFLGNPASPDAATAMGADVRFANVLRTQAYYRQMYLYGLGLFGGF